MTALDELLAEFRATHPAAEFQWGDEIWRYHRSRSKGEAVLWLTGVLGLGEFAFAPILGLGTRFRLLAPDYPPVRTLDRMADGLVAILDAEGVGATHVVAGSLGGMLAQHLVRRHPKRVRCLVLSHTAAPQPSRGRMALVRAATLLPERPLRALFSRRLRASFDVGDPFWLRYFDSTVARLSKSHLVSRVLLAAEFADQSGYGPHDLDNWPGRILILEADDDPLIPEEARAALRALYPQAEVHVFVGTGHSAAISQPRQYAEVIRRFLLDHKDE